MDFYFGEKSHSARFVDFLEGVVPTKASPYLRRRCRGKLARLSLLVGCICRALVLVYDE